MNRPVVALAAFMAVIATPHGANAGPLDQAAKAINAGRYVDARLILQPLVGSGCNADALLMMSMVSASDHLYEPTKASATRALACTPPLRQAFRAHAERLIAWATAEQARPATKEKITVYMQDRSGAGKDLEAAAARAAEARREAQRAAPKTSDQLLAEALAQAADPCAGRDLSPEKAGECVRAMTEPPTEAPPLVLPAFDDR